MRRQDGSGFWCRISGRAVQPGDPGKGYVWLLEDVSERNNQASKNPAIVERLTKLHEAWAAEVGPSK